MVSWRPFAVCDILQLTVSMERLKVDPLHPVREDLVRAARFLRAGGVVAYPTETYYGLGANVFDRGACRRISELKGRERGKRLPLIVSDLEQIRLISDELSPHLVGLADVFWPGPLTLVIPVRHGLGGELADQSTAAVRVSGLPLARELARVAGTPLTATSANTSDREPAQSPTDLGDAVSSGVDMLLDGGPTAGGSPSTIVDISGPEPRLLRAGPVDFDAVLKALEGRVQNY
jgi:L-threonylcarbamoyladenylate synthase